MLPSHVGRSGSTSSTRASDTGRLTAPEQPGTEAGVAGLRRVNSSHVNAGSSRGSRTVHKSLAQCGPRPGCHWAHRLMRGPMWRLIESLPVSTSRTPRWPARLGRRNLQRNSRRVRCEHFCGWSAAPAFVLEARKGSERVSSAALILRVGHRRETTVTLTRTDDRARAISGQTPTRRRSPGSFADRRVKRSRRHACVGGPT